MATSYARSQFSEYVHHLLELHSLAARGMNDSDEADAVRDLMDEPWRRLSEAEESQVGGLSADLYSIGVDRPPPAQVSDERASQLSQLRDMENWDGLLKMLREHGAGLPPADVARLRGICWEQSGEPAVAVVFFQEATRIAPHDAINEVLELMALVAADQEGEAVSRAMAILMPGPHEDAIRLLGASSILFQAADTTQGIDDDLLQLSIDAAERGLELAPHEPANEILTEMRRGAHLRLGLSYLWQDEKQKARAACEKALALAPKDRDSLILLAWIERDESPDLAERHFRSGFLQELNHGATEKILHMPLPTASPT